MGGPAQPQLHRVPFAAMGTACEIRLHAAHGDLARRAVAGAVAEVGRLEGKYSRYRAESLLSAINAAAARGEPIVVDEETSGLLDYAFLCHRTSDGLFDITAGVLRRAWSFTDPRRPAQEDLDILLPRVGMERLTWTGSELGFQAAGMEIDLGGIVKEYAADRAARACRDLGVAHGLVELGGDIAVIGPQPGGAAWPIGIRHPRRAGETLAVVEIADGGLASSGDYERFFEIDGVRYCHILDPRTGWPVRGLAAVTVLAQSCLVAGSIATTAMLKQAEGPDWLAGLAVDYLWADGEGRRGGTPPSLHWDPEP